MNDITLHFEELCTLPDEVKEKMWLYHYHPNPPTGEADAFKGFVEQGQTFIL